MKYETLESMNAAMEEFDVMEAASGLPGESVESYIRRLRQLLTGAQEWHDMAVTAVAAARKDLAETRRRGAAPEECFEVMDRVSELSRAVGRARYRKESLEFYLQDAIFRVDP